MKKGTKGRKFAACAMSLALALGAGAVLSACDSEGNGETPSVVTPQTEKFTVTFSSEGGYVYGTQEVESGRKAVLPSYTDEYGNAITQWYYKYPSGATEYWSFAGYSVTEDMTLYAAPAAAPETGKTYQLDASMSAYINAMGGVEFGDGLYVSSTISELSDGRYLLSMVTDKSQVTIFTVSCDTFIDPEGTNATSEREEVENGTIGYYDKDGNLVTEGVTYTLSAEDDLVNAPDPDGGTNYTQVRYVTGIDMILDNVGELQDLKELELTFFVNSQVMGAQFCNSASSSSSSAAVLTINGMTEIETPEEPDEAVSGIKDAEIDDNGHLILTLSDGTRLDAGLVKGDDGAQGVGISNIVYEAPVLHIYLTNGTHYEFNLETGEDTSLPDNVTETSASCTQDGVRTTYADATKQEVLGVRTIERATGHTYKDGVCETCGHAQEDDMTFALNDDEQGYTLTEYASRAWDTVAVPDTYNGLPVTAIADGATMFVTVLQSGVFMDHTEIKTVVFGSNLKTVGVGAFADCTALESANLSGVTSVGAFAFRNCGIKGGVALNAAVTEIPNNAFYGCTALQSISLPAGLKTIGSSAFYNCSSLESADLPSGLESIGNSAFMNCASLETVSVPAGVASLGTSVFSGCTGIVSASVLAELGGALPNSTFSGCTSLSRFNSDTEGTADLTAFSSIGNAAFMSTAVKTVKFSPTLTDTGSDSFSNCKNLAAVDFNENSGTVTFGNQTFRGCAALQAIALPANCVLGGTMFSGCSSLENIALGGGVEAIPANCFADCVSLEEIGIPDAVTSIGSNAFNGCTSLSSVVFGADSQLSSLAGISGCTSLTSLTIPANVTSVSACTGNYALIEIVNLSGLTLTAGGTDNGSIAQFAKNIVTADPDSGYVTVGDYTLYRDGAASGEKWYVTGFHGAVGEDGALVLPESFDVGEGAPVTSYEIHSRVFYGNDDILSLTVPSSVTAVGAYAYANCPNLASVTFEEGSSLASIDINAFANCTALTAVSLPDSLVSVGNGAFSGCYLLSSVSLGGVQTIGTSAFANCYSLKTLTVPASVTSIASSSFGGCTFAEIRNLAGDIENLPEAYNVYTAQSGQSRLYSADGYTFLYLPGDGETPARAYLVSYGGADGMLTLPSRFAAGDETVSSYEIFAGAFIGKKFTSVAVPAAVTAIGDYAFYRTDLLKITFAGACESVGPYAFAYSNVMFFNSDTAYELDLAGVSAVGDYAFSRTKRLQTLRVAESVASIGRQPFEYSAVKEIVFAESRDEELELANYAFAYMTSLESVTVPSYVTALPQYLFRGCTALSSVTLEEGVQTINNYAFRDCDALASLVLPKSLTKVTSSAFGSSGISSYYYSGTAEELAATSFPTAVKNNAYCYCEEDPISDGNFWRYESGEIAIWPMV